MSRAPCSLSRRQVLQAASAAGLVTVPVLNEAAPQALRVVGLQTAGVDNPLGIEDDPVRLSWRIESARRDTTQVAWRLQVSSTPTFDRADLWDSGRINDGRTFDIRYAGSTLSSRQRAWWRVTVWDNTGRSATSAVAFWEMGLLAAVDWTASWIAAENESDRDDRLAGLPWLAGPPAIGPGTRDFRLRFTLDANAEVDLVYTTTAKTEPFIDGRPLPQLMPLGWLPPAVTTTVTLDAGTHVLALRLHDAVAKPEFLKGAAGCAMLVRVRHVDGRVYRIVGTAARFAADAPDGWTSAGFDDQNWSPVRPIEKAATAFNSHGGALLRHDFSVAQERIASARLYVTALGAHETLINGKPVDDAVLSPEWTDARKRVLYRVHDVTALVHAGANTIGAMVGDGWYGSRLLAAGRFSFGEAPLRYLAQLEIRFANGRVQTVGTDESWQVGHSPVTYSDIYGGEEYDARLEQAGWCSPGFHPVAPWTKARAVPFATQRLEAMTSLPIRRRDKLAPQSIRARNGRYLIDFGQNFTGWASLRVRGHAGQQVTLRFAELLNKDGDLDQANLRSARAADIYTLKGTPGGETYEPRFTYHGFRYLEIEGLLEFPKPRDISGIVLQSDLPDTGHLRIDDPLVMQMWRNNVWSQRSNFTGIPTDCPQRDERLGWLGDANVFWDAGSFNMDLAAFTRRWMGDIRVSQTPEGVVPDMSPTTWGAGGQRGAAPGWADAAVMLPWTVWQRYGDTAIIEQNWDLMSRYLAFVQKANPNLLWTARRGVDYGDWLAFDAVKPGDPTTPKDLIGTAMWKRSASAMALMAQAVGRGDDAARYARLANDIRATFIKAYVQADGTVGNASQTSYILALAFDLVPKEQRSAVAGKLKADIERRGHLTTGFLGTPFSLDVLADAGHAATVYDLLLRTAYPSWGYMVARGATTTWERWNGDTGDISMNSFNHYALGAINGFVYRRVAGIEPLAPGFRRFKVAPVLDARVRQGGGSYDAVVGRITTDWSQGADGSYRLKLSVPANTQAVVVLPTTDITAASEAGRPLRNASVEAGRVVVRVGSGNYDFRTRSSE